jgi:ABC-2 type transport system permease protein
LTESFIENHKAHASSEYLATFKPRLMDWTAARVFAAKNLRIALRYPSNWLVWGFLPIFWYAPYILMMTALAGPDGSIHFTEISGFDDFITFSIVGWFIYSYVDASIWSIGNNFRWEQFSGTLEPLFVVPVPRISILLGAAFSDTVQTSISAFVLLLLSCALFGVGYSLNAIAPIIIVLLMMMIALYGFGFMLAGLILVFKDPSVLTEFVDNVIYTVSPVNYPLQALPTAARFGAFLIPSTLAIIAIREMAITGTLGLVSFIQTILGLGLIIISFWMLGIVSFRYAERWTKQRGSMGGF